MTENVVMKDYKILINVNMTFQHKNYYLFHYVIVCNISAWSFMSLL